MVLLTGCVKIEVFSSSIRWMLMTTGPQVGTIRAATLVIADFTLTMYCSLATRYILLIGLMRT